MGSNKIQGFIHQSKCMSLDRTRESVSFTIYFFGRSYTAFLFFLRPEQVLRALIFVRLEPRLSDFSMVLFPLVPQLYPVTLGFKLIQFWCEIIQQSHLSSNFSNDTDTVLTNAKIREKWKYSVNLNFARKSVSPKK